jgi:hypothetical protein
MGRRGRFRGEESDAGDWQIRDCAIVLPLDVARRVWVRARAWSSEGARVEVIGSMVIVWPRWSPAVSDAEPIGEFSIRWFVPAANQATIYWMAWNRAQGGSEEEVWRVVELLAGFRVRHQPKADD